MAHAAPVAVVGVADVAVARKQLKMDSQLKRHTKHQQEFADKIEPRGLGEMISKCFRGLCGGKAKTVDELEVASESSTSPLLQKQAPSSSLELSKFPEKPVLRENSITWSDPLSPEVAQEIAYRRQKFSREMYPFIGHYHKIGPNGEKSPMTVILSKGAAPMLPGEELKPHPDFDTMQVKEQEHLIVNGLWVKTWGSDSGFDPWLVSEKMPIPRSRFPSLTYVPSHADL